MTQSTLNGNTYSDDGSAARDMQGGGVRNWLLPMMSDAMVEINLAKSAQTYASAAATSATQAANYAAALLATSTTSLTVGAGSQSLTIQAGKQFAAGQYIIISRTSAPTTYMWGTVTSYNSGTGALVISVAVTSGSGTATDWSISISGAQGAQGTMARAYTRAKSANYTAVLGDIGCVIDCSGTWTLSLTAAATLGDGFYLWVRNAGTGTITIDPSGSELISGQSTITVSTGNMALVTCDGSGFSVALSSPIGFQKRNVLGDNSGFTALSQLENVGASIDPGLGSGAMQPIWTGSLFLLSVYASASNIASSPDGLVWTLRALPAAMTIRCMANIGSTVVAIPSSGTAAARSTDGGITWSSMTLPAATSSPSIGVVGGLFVLAHTAASGTAYYTSPDGSAWTSRTFPATLSWEVMPSASGGLLIAASTSSPGTTYYTSPDGLAWTSRTLPEAIQGNWAKSNYSHIAYDGAIWYLASSGNIRSSTDSINWTLQGVSQQPGKIPFRLSGGAWLTSAVWSGLTKFLGTATSFSGPYTNRSSVADANMSLGYGAINSAGVCVLQPNTNTSKVAVIYASHNVYGLFGA